MCQLVFQEAGAGDPQAARERLDLIHGMISLEVTQEALALAQELIRSGAIPEKSAEDALHVAIAVVNSADYLLTWN